MSFVEPEHSRSQVARAGEILASPAGYSESENRWATDVLANWRAAHAYPINTFQATLRTRLKNGFGKSIVAQRLKRTPSILAKLRRFPGMQLSRMQDIGGLRAVVGAVAQVRRLERLYRDTGFAHRLVSSKNYVDDPKEDGYRSVHLIYRYSNDRAPAYEGLQLELQIRSRLQHEWATAVETMGTFLGQALKSGQGEQAWRKFFSTASAALAAQEGTAAVPGFEGVDSERIYLELATADRDLRVLEKLQGFAIAANRISAERGAGAYHLIVLDSVDRSVTIRPFAMSRLDQANAEYAAVERRTADGESVEAVLVSAGPIGMLRKAYPNYFLDTQAFVSTMHRLIALPALMRRRRRILLGQRKRK